MARVGPDPGRLIAPRKVSSELLYDTRAFVNAPVYAVVIGNSAVCRGRRISPMPVTGWSRRPGHGVDTDPPENRTGSLSVSSRTNADDRLALAPLGRIEGGDGFV